MTRIVGYTPEWLQRPSSGWEMFSPKSTAPRHPSGQDDSGRRRKVATRGTEVFVAAGTEIRWQELLALKESNAPYKTLKVSVPLPITHLVISPDGDYMAVATAHTVHVVLLPESSLLESDSTEPIKLKTFQVGPTCHVREESPVVSLLWHPLGYRGRCLVTITHDAVVRLWELNRSDRSSFSEPTLSIDIKKLANATSDMENLSPSKLGASKGFSPDSFELEVASACFGDEPDQEGVHGWAPMTLWIAMEGGDIYALCPLLPSKWQLPEAPGSDTVLETLATSINADWTEVHDNINSPKEQIETTKRQLSWVSDILYSEPISEKLPSGDSITVFQRPTSVPAVPLLQGPFTLSSDDVEYFEISDIIVFSLKSFSESVDEAPTEGLASAVVCLLTDTCKIHICLDLKGVVGRWLPSSEDPYTPQEPTAHELIVAETVALSDDDTSSFNQSITTDVQTDFSFFVSTAQGVFYISFESWVRELERELMEPQSEGLEFRLRRILESAVTEADLCMERPPKRIGSGDAETVEEVNSCVVLADGNLGYFVLTTVDDEPQAVILDAPEHGLPTEQEFSDYMAIELPNRQARPTYQPPRELYEPLSFLQSRNSFVPDRHRPSSKEEIRLSAANLEILMRAHKALSKDTYRLQTAVSDLFVRCNRLRREFRDQIVRVSELTSKIDGVTGKEEELPGVEQGVRGNAKVEERLEAVKKRQEAINARYESIRRKMASVGGTKLSEKEKAFAEELQTMERSLDQSVQTLTDDPDGSDVPAWQRLDKVKGLQKDLAKQAERASRERSEDRAATLVKIPSHSRKQEQLQIDDLLKRESELVEAATSRLQTLGISIPLENGS